MEGNVKWFNRKKGYGFIEGDDQQEYFVHFTGLAPKTFIRENDRVSFDPAETEKGKQAKNVNLLQKGSERGDMPAEEASGPEAQPEPAEDQETSSEEAESDEAEEEERQEEAGEDAGDDAQADEQQEEEEE